MAQLANKMARGAAGGRRCGLLVAEQAARGCCGCGQRAPTAAVLALTLHKGAGR